MVPITTGTQLALGNRITYLCCLKKNFTHQFLNTLTNVSHVIDGKGKLGLLGQREFDDQAACYASNM